MDTKRHYNGPLMRAGGNAQKTSRVGVLVAAVGILVSGCLGPANRDPVARFEASPREGYAPLSVRLDATESYDPDGDSLDYAWSFGAEGTAQGASIERRFGEGDHTITLTVADTRGGTDIASETIVARPVPDGFVVRRYEWTHDGESHAWHPLLPYDLYQEYRSRIRTPLVDNYDYEAYVIDPVDDPTLADFAGVLWNLVGEEPEAFVEMALSFVQGAIDYQVDPADKEWPLYPLETLVDGAGDCEDTAILLVSLLRAKGVGSALATVDTDGDAMPDHVLVLVPVTASQANGLSCSDGAALTIVELDGTAYAVAETTVASGALGLGCDPWGLDAEDVVETWPFD